MPTAGLSLAAIHLNLSCADRALRVVVQLQQLNPTKGHPLIWRMDGGREIGVWVYCLLLASYQQVYSLLLVEQWRHRNGVRHNTLLPRSSSLFTFASGQPSWLLTCFRSLLLWLLPGLMLLLLHRRCEAPNKQPEH